MQEQGEAAALPSEIWHAVIGYLERKERAQVSLVCRAWSVFAVEHNRRVCYPSREELEDFKQQPAEQQTKRILASYSSHSDIYLSALALFGTTYQEKRVYDKHCKAFQDTALVLPILELGGLHKDSDAATVLIGALMILAREPSHEMTIVQNGGITLLVNLMKQHRKCALLQAHAALALCNLSYENENEVIVANSGALEQLSCAMIEHPNCVPLLAHACSAFANLLHFATRLYKEGHVALVIKAMQNHPNERTVQSAACNALANLTSESALASKIIGMGATALVVKAISICNNNELFDEDSLNALQEICSHISINELVFAQVIEQELIQTHAMELLLQQLINNFSSLLETDAPDCRPNITGTSSTPIRIICAKFGLLLRFMLTFSPCMLHFQQHLTTQREELWSLVKQAEDYLSSFATAWGEKKLRAINSVKENVAGVLQYGERTTTLSFLNPFEEEEEEEEDEDEED
ncbi:hypothetical protein QOT17_007467 [Balamuthia mandrillaris]